MARSPLRLGASLEQLTEIGRVLAYPKIRKVLQWDDETIGRFLRQLLLRAETVEPHDVTQVGLRDAADAPILGALIASGADWLVTGDHDLLARRGALPIVKPAELASRL